MKGIYQLFLLAVQASLTFAVLLGVYLVLAVLDYRGGLPAFIGLVAFQPLVGAVFTLATISVCVLVGLPLRLAPFGRWWRQRSYLALGGALMAGGLLLLSQIALGTTAPLVTAEPAVLVLASSSWLLLAFCLLHVFPSETLLRRIGLEREDIYLSEPIEGDGNMPKGEKRNDGFIVASGQPPVLLHATEKALNFVSVTVVFFVQWDGLQAVGPIGNDNDNPLLQTIGPVGVAIIARIGDDHMRSHSLEQGRHPRAVAGLPGGGYQAYGIA